MTALNSPAAERNKINIAEVLKDYLKPGVKTRILEVASGYGTHVMYFSGLFPDSFWHPTEYDPGTLSSIVAHLTLERESGSPRLNVADPVRLDVSQSTRHWPVEVTKFAGNYDFVVNVNMIHISPWQCTLGLFAGAAEMLKSGGRIVMYGPFAVDGVLAPQSNVDFDRSLRLNDPEWGVRDIRDVEEVAAKENFILDGCLDVPSNNKILIWKKL
jgi:hypothetical protein